MRLLVFGFGYSARHALDVLRPRFERVTATVRREAKAATLPPLGVEPRLFGPEGIDPRLADDISAATHVLVSVPPDEDGDPVLRSFAAALAAAPRLDWIGYLSTIGVYGDQAGAWVDEATAPVPKSARSRERLGAEEEWLALGRAAGKPVQVFRIAGIYGPGRNALANLAEGTAKRIVKPGQIFNRIHVADIAAVLAASMDRPRPGAIYNLADDEPAPAQDVVAYAAELLSVGPPPAIPFEEANLSPMAASFYAESKRASNRLIREELGVRLRYPTYREGLRALLEAGEGRGFSPPPQGQGDRPKDGGGGERGSSAHPRASGDPGAVATQPFHPGSPLARG